MGKFKPGDRVKLGGVTPPGAQYEISSGVFVAPGHCGSVVREDQPAYYEVHFDAAPVGVVTYCGEAYLEPAIEGSPKYAPQQECHVSFDPAPCSCSLTTLMRDGCTCGAIARYQPKPLA